jgi:hypothetical protein
MRHFYGSIFLVIPLSSIQPGTFFIIIFFELSKGGYYGDYFAKERRKKKIYCQKEVTTRHAQ